MNAENPHNEADNGNDPDAAWWGERVAGIEPAQPAWKGALTCEAQSSGTQWSEPDSASLSRKQRVYGSVPRSRKNREIRACVATVLPREAA